MPENEEVSFDWMDITERGFKTLAQAAIASGAVVLANGWISGEDIEPTVLVNAVIPVLAAAISFVWNTIKGYRLIHKKELE